MQRRPLLFAVAAAFAAGTLALPAQAQGFPERPVRIIVPFAAGNTLDQSLRLVAEVFRRETGQPLVIDNRPGGGGTIAAQAVATAAPDGYTLLLGNTSMLTINPHTFSRLPYDADKSFAPVTNYLGASMVMAVNAEKVPATNVAEFIAWARPQGDRVSFASFTAGNSSHFAGVIMNQRTGTNMLHVPFNGTPPAVTNLVAGEVHAAFLPLLAVKPHVDSGKVRVLAVTSAERSPLLPAVATFREQGLPEMEIYIWAAVMAPAGTPAPVIARLNQVFGTALRDAEIRDKWATWAFEPLPSTPEALQRFVQAESARWAEAVRISGFKATE